jgi:hypothetical protein
MKIYPKTYEDVFSSPLRKSNMDLVSTDMGIDRDEYTKLLQKQFRRYEATSFNELVKLVWLMRRFCYRGYNRQKKHSNGTAVDRAFCVFMRNRVGYNHSLIGRGIVGILYDYIEEIFPNLDARDPFKEKMKYPFRYVGFSHLVMVSQFDDRMDFIRMAEKKKMSFAKFADYVINYVYCLNEERGEEVYRFFINELYLGTPYAKRVKKVKTSGVHRGAI